MSENNVFIYIVNINYVLTFDKNNNIVYSSFISTIVLRYTKSLSTSISLVITDTTISKYKYALLYKLYAKNVNIPDCYVKVHDVSISGH